MRVFALVVMLAACDAGAKQNVVIVKDASVALFAGARKPSDRPPPCACMPPAEPERPIAHAFVSYDVAFYKDAYLRFPAEHQTLQVTLEHYNGHEYFAEHGTHRFWIRNRADKESDWSWYGPFEIVNQ